MQAKNFLVLLVAIFALVLVAQSASAVPAEINCVEVNGIACFSSSQTAGVFAGETIDVRVTFRAVNDSDDARVVARILGEPGLSDVTERFDVLAGNTYSRVLRIKLPFDIDPSEDLTLEVSVETSSDSVEVSLPLEVQRSSYEVEILSVEGPTQISAGEVLPLDVVLKNRGRHEAEDTYVTATIAELGISKTVYFGDLSAEDESDPDKFDSAQRMVYLSVPKTVAAGLYTLEVEAHNSDASTVRTQRIYITAGTENSNVVSSANSKSFSVGDEEVYTMTIVNSGNSIAVYNLVVDADEALNVNVDESVVVVPAGSSKVVRFSVSASEEGRHDFTVNVQTQDGSLVSSKNFSANVEGRSIAGNAAVLLTVVLAIVFIVLLVVLIVLLTRRPEKTENLGESYY